MRGKVFVHKHRFGDAGGIILGGFIALLRLTVLGRDFYGQELERAGQPFWERRRGWPDAQPLHLAADWAAVQVARRPVLRDGLVDEAEVVVTADQPLGVWHLQGIELAPVVRELLAGRSPLAAMSSLPAEHQRMLMRWLADQGAAQSLISTDFNSV